MVTPQDAESSENGFHSQVRPTPEEPALPHPSKVWVVPEPKMIAQHQELNLREMTRAPNNSETPICTILSV